MNSSLLPSVSGVIPAYAQIADFGPPRSECGIGCLMPWNGKLYILNYVSHRRHTGTGSGLRVIDGEIVKGQKIRLMGAQKDYVISDLGKLSARPVRVEDLHRNQGRLRRDADHG